MITPCSAAADAPLCFSPLPELASLRTSTTRFSVGPVVGNAATVLVPNTTNAYGINITFDVSALLDHPRAVPTTSAEAGATLAVGIFHDASAADGTSLPAVMLRPPWNTDMAGRVPKSLAFSIVAVGMSVCYHGPMQTLSARALPRLYHARCPVPLRGVAKPTVV